QEDWKIESYEAGKDVYCVLAAKFFNLEYEEIADKSGPHYQEKRPRGKYSELSCGYQASATALQNFMFRLGFVIDETRALEDVQAWRKANPKIVELWE